MPATPNLQIARVRKFIITETAADGTPIRVLGTLSSEKAMSELFDSLGIRSDLHYVRYVIECAEAGAPFILSRELDNGSQWTAEVEATHARR